MTNHAALWLGQSGGTLARPIRRHSGLINFCPRKDVPSNPLKQVQFLVFLGGFWWSQHSKQKAVSANGSASRVCLHTCLFVCPILDMNILQLVKLVKLVMPQTGSSGPLLVQIVGGV